MVSSPKQRRQSIAAVPSPSKHKYKHRRRAHSIVLGERTRRSLLAPRKSILKPPTDNNQTDAEDGSNDDTDYTVSRKSLARRVSFAQHAKVRIIDKLKADTSNSTMSPSPSPEAHRIATTSAVSRPLSNENDYPGAKPRRSSMRASFAPSDAGEHSMNLTNVYSAQPVSSWDDEVEDDNQEEGNIDMDDTEDLKADIMRRQSLLPAKPAAPDISIRTESSNASYSEADDSATQEHIEYSVPINKSLRPPAHEDPNWMALRAMTDSGKEPFEPLDDSFEEDMSLGTINQHHSLMPVSHDRGPYDDEEPIESSFSGSEDNIFSAEETINLSTMFGKPLARSSLAGADIDSTMDVTQGVGQPIPFGRLSIAPSDQNSAMEVTQVVERGSLTSRRSMAISEHIDSTMDVTEMLEQNGNISLDLVTTEPSLASTLQPSTSVFSRPVPASSTPFTFTAPTPRPSISSQPSLTKPMPFSFTSRPPSPSKSSSARTSSPSKPKPTFTAAFAPPVVKPSPKKVNALANADTPQKRAASDGDAVGSPAKRRSVAPDDQNKTTPLSHQKLTTVQASLQASGTKDTTSKAAEKRSSLRRPSGYLSRRKSVSFGLAHPTQENDDQRKAINARASLGAGVSNVWKNFDKNTPVPAPHLPLIEEPEPTEEAILTINEPTESPSLPAPRHSVPPISSTLNLSRPSNLSLFPDNVSRSNNNAEDLEAIEVSDLSTEQEKDGDDDITGKWVEGIQQQEQEFTDEYNSPPISITQFFEMTGIRFMDEITAPRRSSIHPSLSSKPKRYSSLHETDADTSLAAYFTALAVDIPQLSLYMRVSSELQDWIENSKDEFRLADEEALQMTPELFREYTLADDEGRKELTNQLDLIRHNMRGKAKAEWYDWRMKWVQDLYDTAAQRFQFLQADARHLEEVNKTAESLIPERKREYEQVMDELQKEQQEVEELEKCDQQFLTELKASIADANAEVEALEAEVSDKTAQLEWLEQQLAQVDAENEQLSSVISQGKRVHHLQHKEVFKLQAELEVLEDLHQIHAVQVTSDLFEYNYTSRFRVSIPCRQFVPRLSDIRINKLEDARTWFKDPYPHLSDHFLKAARDYLVGREHFTCSQIVRYISDFWSSCNQIRTQLRFLHAKFPMNIELGTNPGDFSATVTVLFPIVKSKASITFTFSAETISRWPVTIAGVGCDVKIIYGSIKQKTVFDAITERMAEATLNDNHLYLLDACLGAVGPYI